MPLYEYQEHTGFLFYKRTPPELIIWDKIPLEHIELHESLCQKYGSYKINNMGAVLRKEYLGSEVLNGSLCTYVYTQYLYQLASSSAPL